ncbi:unnamed protein product [Rotaria sp. Silwood2]|nr:unnamed protein product [Rotaria sp. Silwood2]CAF2671843.1 unnamed protein product [Rotaria sp. Silwood2]CAF2932325.1 unnamed protein product [Rotaria sp. Silwood2]CAF3135817.1 unnamed protein product [Rotaria sp. Silwood2]CAF3920122.1 unnamed protein product [Rotaria sp. Silwood2]
MTTSQSEAKRYLIEEKYLSLDNRFTITDDLGNIHYKGNSTFFAIGDKLLLTDEQGNEAIRIRQESFHIHLTYKLFSVRFGGTEHQIALIKRIGPLRQQKLEISSNDGEYILQKQHGLSSNEFTLTKDSSTVAVVTKDASPTKSFYWVDIIDNKENHAFILAIVIVLACVQRSPTTHIAMPLMN